MIFGSCKYESSLLKIRQLVLNRKIECSGAIFDDGSFSFLAGDEFSAYVEDKSDFIWHSHPNGNLVFSFDDWLCFFISKATYTALFADNKILIVKKTDFHNGLQNKLRDVLHEYKGFPSIIYFKLFSILSDWFSVNIENLSPEKLIGIFKVEYQIL